MILWIGGGVALLVAILLLWPSRAAREAEMSDPPQHSPEPKGPSDPQDRQPFGEELARRMWRHVMASPQGYGLCPHAHPHYCGHGLARMGRSVLLCDVEDARPLTERPIARWDDEAEFTAFFARQTNFTVNGYDRAEPVFFTEDEWALANQRLNREAVESVLARPGG